MPLNLQPNFSEPGKRYFQTFTNWLVYSLKGNT